MTFKDFFSKSLEKNIISQFQELNMSSDIVMEYHGKNEKIKSADVDWYKIKNKYFDSKGILIYHDKTYGEYYISSDGSYEPYLFEDIVSYIDSKFNTEMLVKKNLKLILKDINWYNEKLKDFGNTESLMEIEDIEALNQVYNALNMPDKKIVVDKNAPYSTWMITNFFIVHNLDEITQWIQTQIDASNEHESICNPNI